VIVGDTIKIGYYTQSGINPKPGQRVIDILRIRRIYTFKGAAYDFATAMERFFI
jgi:ATP-binding cassette subfamily F protein uup